jgi:hypothetical protein
MSAPPLPRASPLSVLVHIPKTAGSSVSAALLHNFALARAPRVWPLLAPLLPAGLAENPVAMRALARRFAGGCPFASRLLTDPATFDRVIAGSDWVGGHIRLADWEGHLARVGRSGRYFTQLRDPVDQVASHYQWWIEIHDRGPLRFWRYGPFWRDLSRRIRAADNRDPRAIIAILEEHHTLFLNIQSQYVLRPGDRADAAGMLAALDRFAAVGIGGDIGPVVRAMSGREPPVARRANRSRSAFDRSVFRHPAMAEFLAAAHARDILLWQVARARAAGLRA